MVCYIGVGSNLGDRRAYIEKAIAFLNAADGVRIRKVSPVYETKPEGGPRGQSDFLNLVIRADCAMTPKKLLLLLKNVERLAGRRVRKKRWAAREIDLDILLCGGRVINRRALQIPHPLMHKRIFVLKPLLEIAPKLKHPVLKKSIKMLLESLSSKDKDILK